MFLDFIKIKITIDIKNMSLNVILKVNKILKDLCIINILLLEL